MKGKYIKISRPDLGGSYIEPISKIRDVIDAEFDCFPDYVEIGDILTFEVIEFDDEEYKKLPEFTGW